MICMLCLCVERDEHLIDIQSAESQQHNVASILHLHFPFCFQEEPADGYFCQKCWVKVSVFHEFYTHIEYVHRSNESIFVESIIDGIKSNADLDGDTFFPNADPPVVEKTEPDLETVKTEYQHPPSFDLTSDVQMGNLTNLKDDGSEDDSDDGIDNFDSYFTPPTPSPTIAKPKKGKTKPSKTKSKLKRVKKERPEGYVKRKWTRREPKSESKTFQCKTCELHFLSFNRLDRHIKETHEVKAFKCEDSKCVDSFDTQQLLDEHIELRHKRSECPHCKKNVLETFLAKHIENRHGTGHVICELCGKVSLNKQMHKEHFKATHEVAERLQCDICVQWFKNRVAIRSHMTNKHIYGPEQCDVCGHTSPNRKALIEHKRLHKPGAKDRWKCDVCFRGFREKKKLEEHYHIHTGTAGSYHCSECGKIFRFSSSFSVHKKKMHPK